MTARRPVFTAVGSAVAISPQQFHDGVEAALRTAVAARASGPRAEEDEGMRALAGLLQEVPALAPDASHPPFVAPLLVDGVRQMIARRHAEAATDPEALLADLMEFVLAFYPEAVPPPAFSDQL
jgi:hypothetical protein